jgi:cob(I)alamin adenosyltransferase
MSDENRIYTRTGDAGTTGLFGGGRVSKSDVRVDAYGEVDELNACIGSVLAVCSSEWVRARLTVVQSDLFAIGAHLATPPAADGRRQPHLPVLPSARVAEMEAWMDEASKKLEPLRAFILPGGTQCAAALHLARTVTRRAERRVINLSAASAVPADIVTYLNRLSDFLFVAARLTNHEAGVPDSPWTPST